ncbi:deoxyribonuclease TATDN1 isoform X1 [Dermacentor variabilis]|uniref:deoxyribonuclease TATDN1 isoform X1 n=1 Tax=Dermacentor variabilis TaxID=34621 RepID=UPI003F5BF46A
MAARRRLIDIGANLTDPMFRGLYNGSRKHPDDFDQVLQRAQANGVHRILVTGGSLEDSRQALELASAHGGLLWSTVGCHPTRCGEFEGPHGPPDRYLEQLSGLVRQGAGRVAALGEMGLDYERLQFCDRETQLRYLELQLQLVRPSGGLPLFLHCRKAAPDLLDVLSRNRGLFTGAVVHSFDGSKEEAAAFLDLGLFIGINGCSLKTAENLAVAATIPRERLLIETDCPWCEIRPTHAGAKLIRTSFPAKKKERFEAGFMVKGRNEPANLVQVLEVLAGIHGEDPDALAKQVHINTCRLFFPGEEELVASDPAQFLQ